MPSSPHRSVHFSQYSELTVFKSNATTKSYSADDINRFAQDSIRIGLGMANLLATNPAETITQEHIYEWVGNELLLKRGLVKDAINRKRAHIDAILLGQHLMNSEDLTNLSMVSSNWAQKRAKKSALAYITFLNK